MAQTTPQVTTARNARKNGPENGNGVPWYLLFAAAAAIGVVYIGFALFAFARADDTGITESGWLRTVFVIQGIEAIAFTAIGWLFGREVHRGAAEAAKEQAEEAKQDEKEAKVEAVTAREVAAGAGERAAAAERDGWRLAEAIRARAEAQGGVAGPGGDESSPADAPPAPPAGLDGLKSLADSLFPPR